MTCEYSDITCAECCDTEQYHGCLVDTRERMNNYPQQFMEKKRDVKNALDKLEETVVSYLEFHDDYEEFISDHFSELEGGDSERCSEKYGRDKFVNMTVGKVKSIVKP